MIDCLVGPSLNARLIGRKVSATKVRGTGCTLASAMAAFYVHMLREQRSQSICIQEAIVLAKAYLQQGLDQDELSQERQRGSCPKTGWPKEPKSFPVLEDKDTDRSGIHHQAAGYKQAIHEQAMHKGTAWLKPAQGRRVEKTEGLRNQSILYPIVSSLNDLELCLKNQVAIVQLRLKTGANAARLQTIRTGIHMAKGTQTSLYINDEWQWALEEQAFGVHLGQEDLATASLTAIREAGLALGVSTHGYWELLKTLNLNPSYVAIGSIFPTTTKDMTGQIQGLNHLCRLASICNHYNIPCVAIGGIQLEKLPAVLVTKVKAVAVVSAITQAVIPATAIQLWMAPSLLAQVDAVLDCSDNFY